MSNNIRVVEVCLGELGCTKVRVCMSSETHTIYKVYTTYHHDLREDLGFNSYTCGENLEKVHHVFLTRLTIVRKTR